jgi:hypothetical protein
MAEGNTARLGLDEEPLGGYYQTLALSFVSDASWSALVYHISFCQAPMKSKQWVDGMTGPCKATATVGHAGTNNDGKAQVRQIYGYR